MNFHIFETSFSDSTHILSNISIDSGAFQPHANTVFVFITFIFNKIRAI